MKKALILFSTAMLVLAAVGLALADPAQAQPLTMTGLLGSGSLALIVNAANLSQIFINLKTTFNKAFEAAPSIWEKTTMKVPSGSAMNDYKWLSRFPKMIKWVGEKTIKSLSAFSYTIVNDDYEATVEVDRNDIEDDSLGIYAPMAQEAGYSAKQLPDEIDAELKNNSFTSECHDGQYFYDTDHPIGDGDTFSNKGTAALSAASQAGALGSYGAGRTAVMNFKDDEGRALGLVPNLLEVPPALEATARLLCYSPKLADDTPNPYQGTAEVLVNPRLTSATAWFLHVTNRPLKPFIYQERKAPVFVQQTDMSSDDVFSRKKFKFGAEARAAGGYGLPQLSYGSTGAA